MRSSTLRNRCLACVTTVVLAGAMSCLWAYPALGLVVDHSAVLEFDQIPDQWIETVKNTLTFHYAHTSHGGQIIAGLKSLAAMNPQYEIKYKVLIREYEDTAGLPSQETPPGLRIYDGNAPETYIEPYLYWDGEYGQDLTRAVVDTGLFDYSMWAWCGQQSWNEVEDVNRYLATLDTFESEYPDMRFIYMTGHTDGDSESYLVRNNDMVRSYVAAHNKVLYDFADIERWDPDGTYYPDTDDSCPWCYTWCEDHPTDPDCVYRPEDDSECEHSHGLNCMLKAKAFWWMLARLAGWEGVVSDGFIPDGIWKDAPIQASAGTMNFYVQTYTNGAILILASPDGMTCYAFIDPDYTDGVDAYDLGGQGHYLSASFSSATTGSAVLTLSGGSDKQFTLFRWFAGSQTENYQGIWKDVPPIEDGAAVNLYIQTYDTAVVLITTPDARQFFVFQDPDKTDGVDVDAMGGNAHITCDVTGGTEGSCELSYGGAPGQTYTVYRWFQAPYAVLAP